MLLMSVRSIVTFAFSGHKMLGLTGIGGLYGKRASLGKHGTFLLVVT
jgi:selenocysteine lyase/cysteine desulfurase